MQSSIKVSIFVHTCITLTHFLCTECVNLHLEHLHKCTFHLVHFYDRALSESVLASNQYLQQPWTVYNVSRPPLHVVKAKQEREYDSWPFDRDSRFCNVHLLIRPRYEKEDDADLYPQSLNVREPDFTSFVFVTDTDQDPAKDAKSGYSSLQRYTFRLFHYQVDAGADMLRRRIWHCPTCSTTETLEKAQKMATAGHPMYTMGQHFHGLPILIDHNDFRIAYQRLPCPNEFYSRRAIFRQVANGMDTMLLYECYPKRKLPVLLAEKLNASASLRKGVDHRRVIQTSLMKERALIQTEHAYTVLKYDGTASHWLSDNQAEYLYYCDGQPMRDRAHWFNAFEVITWTTLAVAILAAAMVASVSVEDRGRFRLRLDLFNILRLIQQEGRVRSKLQLGIMIMACMFFDHYENYLTSVAMAPSPPHTYTTVSELLEHGHKIHFSNRQSLWIETKYKAAFKRLGISHLLNSSFYLTTLGSHQALINVDRVAMRAYAEAWSTRKLHLLLKLIPFMDNRTCHIVQQPLLEFRPLWTIVHGTLRDEMLRWVQRITEHGLPALWWEIDMHLTETITVGLERENRRTAGNLSHLQIFGISSGLSAGPARVSMEFEIVMIFPYCGYLLAVATLAFICEVGLWFIIAATAIQRGTAGLGL